MFNTEVSNLVNYLLDKGIQLSLTKNDLSVGIDINTGAKSGCVLVPSEEGSELIAHMRYGDKATIDLQQEVDDVVEDLCYLVKSCMQGRDYVDSNWLELMVEKGVIKKVVKTTYSYE